jgi:hypothetical protein
MAIWRTLSGNEALAVMARVKSQIAFPIAGSCSHGFHGPISAPSSRSTLKALKLLAAPAHLVVERLLLRG